MASLRSRLILSHLLPLLIVIPLAGLVLIYTLETQVVLADLSDRLTERANLIVQALQEQPEVWKDDDQAAIFISDISEIVQGQFLLLRSDGSLIASYTSESPTQPIDASQLEGFKPALQGEKSVIIQYRLQNPSRCCSR
jgi:hypothetical protein